MKKLFKKIVASFLAATMTMSAVAFTAFAEGESESPAAPTIADLTLKLGAESTSDTNVIAYVNGNKDNKSVELTATTKATGKFVAVLTEAATRPTVTSGTVKSDDSVKDIAKVAVKDDKVTITAGKKTGAVYVHLFDIKNKEVVGQTGASGVKVNIKGAASSIGFYSDSAMKVAAKTIVVGSGTTENKVYFKGLIKDAAKGVANTLADDIAYTVEADSKNKIELTVAYSKENNYFTVKAPSLAADAKGKVKTASGKVIVTNTQSGKKASVTIIVENDIKKVENTIKTGYAKLIDEKGDVSKIDVTPTLQDAKIAGTSKVSVVILDGEENSQAEGNKGKNKTPKSKLASAKLQVTKTGYRVRITNSGAKADVVSAIKNDQVVYLVVTNAAKKTNYIKIGTVSKGLEVAAFNPAA